MAFGVHPIILVAVIGVILGFIAFSVAWLTQRGLLKAAMSALTVIFFLPALYVFHVLHPEILDARFRTYKAFYRDITVGMTRAEVFTLIDRHYPKSGPRQRPTILRDELHELKFFMNPERSLEPNCEGIFLYLDVGGRVTGKEYSPD
jgi:hypothetical protein